MLDDRRINNPDDDEEEQDLPEEDEGQDGKDDQSSEVSSVWEDDDDDDGKDDKDDKKDDKKDKDKNDDDDDSGDKENKDEKEDDQDASKQEEGEKVDSDNPEEAGKPESEPEDEARDLENEAQAEKEAGKNPSQEDMSLADKEKPEDLRGTGEVPEQAPTGVGAGTEAGTGAGTEVGAAGAEAGAAETAGEAGAVAAETGAEAGTAAAEAGAAAGETAAVGAEAGAATGAAATAGEAAGTAAAGAAGGAAIGALGIVILVILIILILIGVFAFLTAIPSMTLEKLKEMVMGIWDGIQGYIIGIDKASVNNEDVVEVAQYLYNMGYDLEGCGFVEDVEFEKDSNGNSTGTIKKVKSSYLTAYLVAENRTYLISNDNFSWASVLTSIKTGKIMDGLSSSWGTGMIHIDGGIWSSDAAMIIKSVPIVGMAADKLAKLISDVSVDRETNTLKISRSNFSSGLAFWDWKKDVTYYNLAGWSGRYGKPFELLVALHLATMAPDFAYQIAMNDDLDTRVNIGLKNATFKGSVKLKTADGLTYTVDQLKDAGYSDSTIDEIKELAKSAKNIKTKTPYIKTVTHHWFRNVYFDTDGESVEYAVVEEPDEDEEEEEKKQKDEYYEKEDVKYVYEEVDGEKRLKTTTGAVNVYESQDESSETFDYTGEIEGLNEGDKVIFEGSIADKITQKEDGVRGVTNPTTKKLFKDKYYIYDGTTEKAQSIRDGKEKKEQITFNKESLSAFSMLEHETSIDSQLIYRDLKELLVELDYFDYEDFEESTERVLAWPIPDYQDTVWPDRRIEKQILEYGTLIASKPTVDAFKEEEKKKQAEENGEEYVPEEQPEESNQPSTSNPTSLEGFIMIGDSWTVGLESLSSVKSSGLKTFSKSGAAANYWISNYSQIGSQNAKGVIVYLGLNSTTASGDMKTLLGKLKQSYPSVPIYVLKVPHVAKSVNNGMNPSRWNSQIDTRNSEIESYCNSNGLKFIDTTEGIIGSDGYLSDKYASGGGYHLTGAGYELFFQNIKKQIENGGGADETVGFEEGLDVVAMEKCKVLDLVNTVEYGPSIMFELTGDTILKGYTLLMAGFDVSVSAGDEFEAKDVIGTTNENNIVIMLIDLEKANVENVEEYVKIPKKSKKLSGGSVEEKVWIALKEANYSDEAAAGVMGNIYGESGFDPSVVEHGSGIGFGLCQWSYGRRTQLENFARSRGVDPSDADLQIEFLLAELQPGGGADGYASYQFAGHENDRNIWMTSSSIEETTTAFCRGFERPGNPRNQVRIDAAKKYYEQYAGGY